jgi:hypothetical protein
VTGNTFCFGFIQRSGRIGSGVGSGCPATNGTISIVTGNTKTGSCIREMGFGRIRIPVVTFMANRHHNKKRIQVLQVMIIVDSSLFFTTGNSRLFQIL